MFDDKGKQVKEAGPAMPVEILGLEEVPQVGDLFQVVTDLEKAKQLVEYRKEKEKEQAQARGRRRTTLERLHEQIRTGETKELRVVLKADVSGTAEALREAMEKLSTDKIAVKVIHEGVGAISESDILLAAASDAIVIGFNVRPDRKAAQLAEQEHVDVRLHTVIYELLEELRKAMVGMLEPEYRETIKGRAEIKQVFKITGVGNVAGCVVLDGVIARDNEVRVIRDGVLVYTGKIASMKRYKDDVNEVRAGMECGIAIANFNDIKPGDILEAFVKEQIKPEISVLGSKR